MTADELPTVVAPSSPVPGDSPTDNSLAVTAEGIIVAEGEVPTKYPVEV